MLYIYNFFHILQTVYGFETIKDCTQVFVNIVTGMSIIKGFNYLKSLKDKTNSATFTFWSQFRIRIHELKNWLEADETLINNLYDPKIRATWEGELSQGEERVEKYKEKIKQTISYIENTPDQMPAYEGWTSDYNKIIVFLYDMIQYDICNSESYFKFVSAQTINDRKQYCKDICNTMTRMCEKIEQRQAKVEQYLFNYENK